MKRHIVKIDEALCNGCGACIQACHEGALELVNGKAHLVSDSYCDGLGACLPECPTGAITVEEREADEYKEATYSTQANDRAVEQEHACGCPGTQARTVQAVHPGDAASQPAGRESGERRSQLRQWPCQLKLVSPNAPYFQHAHLLVAADCTAYAYAAVHEDFMQGRITLIGCPKLDDADYSEKLAAILVNNDVRSVTVLRMEVPCCGGLVKMVKNALVKSGVMIPWRVVTISAEGAILEDV